MSPSQFDLAKELSPRRKSTKTQTVDALVNEQLEHFGVDPKSAVGQQLADIANHVYRGHADLHRLWHLTLDNLKSLDRADRISFFNAKRFICFQMAKMLDTLTQSMRKSYQSLTTQSGAALAKGPYPILDNVPAIFSAAPVITRTATYLYACTEWIEDAFQGKELMHDIYSRLLNPTSVSLANHIVDVVAGPYVSEYFAWNFNSGMAALDALFGHVLGYQDVILCNRNVYGGTYQLLRDWYGKPSNLNVRVEWFDGFTAEAFEKKLFQLEMLGKKIYIFIESPCNPHGYVLDVPGICRSAHKRGLTVLCDATVGTPFLNQVLIHKERIDRPDFVVHSYTKDLSGSGTTTAGVVIGRNETMFIPKGESVQAKDANGTMQTYKWNDTMFWNVYFIKGAFLDSDKAFEVLTGMRTLELRMLKKCINTMLLSKVLNSHPDIQVHCNYLPDNENSDLREKHMYLGMPAPLFTIDFKGISTPAFKRFFDNLEPGFGLQVSLGQTNTVVLCPALTSHSEMDEKALKEAGISRTTIRISVGDENPKMLLAHFIEVCRQILDKEKPGFSDQFMKPGEIDRLYEEVYLETHRLYIKSQPSTSDLSN